MDCQEVQALLGELVHGELEEESGRAVRAHLDECPSCHDVLAEERALQELLRARLPRFQPPPSLWADALGLIDRSEGRGALKRRGSFPWQRAALVAAAALLVLGAVRLFSLSDRGEGLNPLVVELVNDHIREIMSGNPPPVVSSDLELLLAWFADKGRLSLPVSPQDPSDPQLVGARLTYALGRRIPVLVYRHRERLISFFVLEAKGLAMPEEEGQERKIRGLSFYLAARKGYHMVGWKSRDLVFCVVSDLPSEELLAFASVKAAS